MINPHIHAALARERRASFLAEAETARRARQARIHRQQASTSAARKTPLRRLPDWLRPARSRLPRHRPRPAVEGTPAVLRGGSRVLIRQVRSTDAPLLADGFARLSAQSRRMRFLTNKKRLSPAELRYLTEIDRYDHEALGALSPADGRGVGIARYVRDADDPKAACRPVRWPGTCGGRRRPAGRSAWACGRRCGRGPGRRPGPRGCPRRSARAGTHRSRRGRGRPAARSAWSCRSAASGRPGRRRSRNQSSDTQFRD